MTGPESYWDGIRAQFDLDPAVAYLAGFWLSMPARPVQERINAYRTGLDRRGVTDLLEHHGERMAESTLALAELLGFHPDHVTITGSATESLALVFGGLALAEGGEILFSTHDHYSLATAARMAAERTRGKVRVVDYYQAGEAVTAEGLVDRVIQQIGSETRLIGLTWVHSGTGLQLPIPAILEQIAAVNRRRSEDQRILTLVDATHAIGAIEYGAGPLPCDFLIGSGHKWLNGPRGTGFLAGRPEALQRLTSPVPSFARGCMERFMGIKPATEDSPASRLTPGGFKTFEARWGVGPAVRYFTALDTGRVYQRIRALSKRLQRELGAIAGVRVVTPEEPALSAGLVCCAVGQWPAGEAAAALRRSGVICGAGPYAESFVRFSPFVYSSQADLDRAVDAVARLASGDLRSC